MSDRLKNISMAVLIALLIGFVCWRLFSSNLVYAQPELKPLLHLVDIETGEHKIIELTEDFPGWPVPSSKTGKSTLYPAEICYWGKCREQGGTWVVLNTTLGKNQPTYCPVCGRRVVAHNPIPPDIAQYLARGEDFPRTLQLDSDSKSASPEPEDADKSDSDESDDKEP